MSTLPTGPFPVFEPDDALPDQLAALELWLCVRLDTGRDHFAALETAHAYVQWLAYRAEQIRQQLEVDLWPPDPHARITTPYGTPSVPRFPNRDRRHP
ncbi:hypothetical protein [Catellatospora citrea]|uniref:Uncharacterized protein n=1 Tax=Catellatospora citrea TaxID=53366 RepID=A0A8J3P3T4_9ACTN|nr:hypothetical protein [Catellatospora citrea]RKE08371.1 hypothetical protein C8E86_3221 [Catellatospora citrea]GIG03153.1 hypothetical protein Cci01nite_82460 [Catellatospora citrea]